jgi:hypothetical protein
MLTYANKLLLSVAKNKENLTSKFLESLALTDGSDWVPTFNLPMKWLCSKCSQYNHCCWVAVDDKILRVILKVFLETLLL